MPPTTLQLLLLVVLSTYTVSAQQDAADRLALVPSCAYACVKGAVPTFYTDPEGTCRTGGALVRSWVEKCVRSACGETVTPEGLKRLCAYEDGGLGAEEKIHSSSVSPITKTAVSLGRTSSSTTTVSSSSSSRAPIPTKETDSTTTFTTIRTTILPLPLPTITNQPLLPTTITKQPDTIPTALTTTQQNPTMPPGTIAGIVIAAISALALLLLAIILLLRSRRRPLPCPESPKPSPSIASIASSIYSNPSPMLLPPRPVRPARPARPAPPLAFDFAVTSPNGHHTFWNPMISPITPREPSPPPRQPSVELPPSRVTDSMVVAPLNVLRPTSPDENEVEAYVPPTRPTHAGAANIARADSVVWRRSVADAKERAAVRVSLMVTEPIIEAVGPETQGGSAGKRGSVFGGGRGRRFSLVGGAV